MSDALKCFVVTLVCVIFAFVLGSIDFEHTRKGKVAGTVIAKSGGDKRTGKHSYGPNFILAVKLPSGYAYDIETSLATYSAFEVGSGIVVETSPFMRNEPSPWYVPARAVLLVLALVLAVFSFAGMVVNALDGKDF